MFARWMFGVVGVVGVVTGCTTEPDPTVVIPPPVEVEPAAPAEAEVQAPVLATPPALPPEAWLQVFDRQGRILHRLTNDGRYEVQRADSPAHTMAPLSRIEPGMERISPAARARIDAAIAAVAFFGQPETVEAGQSNLEVTGPAAFPRHLALSVRNSRDHGVHTVFLVADMAVPSSFGPLEPLWKSLQDDVFGGWKVAPPAPSP